MPAKARFAMPKPVRITGRTSSITNSFINGIIPVIWPTEDQISEALGVLGMDEVVCAYCGDAATEWDHFRPLVVAKQPTGYISEIHNLVPACGKCNQSKGNKYWREWMFSSARLSPFARGVPGITERAARLDDFERWGSPTRVDFAALVGADLWQAHWQNYDAIIALMRAAEQTADAIRAHVAAAHAGVEPMDPAPTEELSGEAAPD